MIAKADPLLGAAVGAPHVLPVGGLVAGCLEAERIDEGFEQKDIGTKMRTPIPAKPPDVLGEHMGGQMRDAYPGGDEKPAVVDDLVQLRFALGRRPADVLIAGAGL